MNRLTFGNVPVPYTVSWSGEEHFFVGHCRFAGGLAICQDSAPVAGKPKFGSPHSNRQREAVANDLCDLCARPLKGRTKVSLSHSMPFTNGAEGMAVLQVEPLLHRECAAISALHCPSLKRDARERGGMQIRQVLRHRVQIAIVSPEFVGEYVPGYRPAGERVFGHAKVELLAWKDRDDDWLTRAA